jgi:ligand-binding sensor domain-containing protein/signal transduction histidine kinase/CheY-like chemotaxis protein/AraC-like DNA-binding protein
MSIVQDARGMMWYGTRYGLNKYDARKFKAYHQDNTQPGLSDDYIVSLFCDSRNTLWAGTLNGLNRYQPQKDVFEQVNIPLPPSGESSKTVNAIYEDRKGRLWVAMDKSLVVLTDRAKDHFSIVQSFSDRTIKCIREDHAGTIWVGTSKGLLKLSGQLPRVTVSSTGIDERLQQDYITSIAEDPFHTLWIGTFSNGVKQYNPATHTIDNFVHTDNDPHSLVNNSVRKLLFDRNGQLWIGTQEGLSIKTAAHQFTNFVHDDRNKTSLSQNSIYSLYEDREGTIWIGTFFGGVNSFDHYSTSFSVYQSGGKKTDLSNNVVSSIIEDSEHHLWIGTEGGGLNYIDRQTGAVSYFQHKPNDPTSISSNLVKVIYKDKSNNIWAGTHGGGLNLYHPATRNFTRFFYKEKDAVALTSEITSIHEDSSGRFWVGTQTGLMVFKRQGSVLVPDLASREIVKVLDQSMVLYLFLDSKQKLWIGTHIALYMLKGNELKMISTPPSPDKPAFRVNCITEDSQQNIWVGTYYNGLYQYSIDGAPRRSFTPKDGLPDNNILGILEDDKQNLWISTGNGLSKYDASRHLFLNYYMVDGLAGNVFNNNAYYKSASGDMYFGGYNGLTRFRPQDIKEHNKVPPVVLSAFSVVGKPIAPGSLLPEDISLTKSIELQHDQNVFSVEFSVLNYIKSGKNRYAYQLQGFDEEWHYTETPNISFTNLPPGHYSLLMKGSNNDGFWSQPLVVEIRILPPFWKTWKAYALYLLAIGLLIFFITRFFFLREWVKKNNKLTQLKLNFFTNISHEIRTHLSLIIGPAEKLLVHGSGGLDDQQQLHVIKNNSESLLQLVNELMDFRRAETGNLKLQVSQWDLVSFLRDIHASFHDLSLNRNIVTEFAASSSTIEVWFDKEQLEKVFFNLLSNAFKFTGSGGQISIRIEEKKNSVEVTITDNGKGISKENMEKLFDNYFQEEHHGTQNNGYGIGLALSKSIVEIHQGTITVQSEPATDSQESITSFTVALQKGKEHFDSSCIMAPTQHQPLGVPVRTPEATVLTAPVSLQPGETKHTILLVEDNADIRHFITSSLQDQYHFLTCDNGLQGWEVAIDTIPDIIISDVMMPEMDGISLCSKLKTDQRTSHIPVILLTAKSTTSNQVTGLQTGADLYLTKPFSLQVLSLHLYNIIAARERLWLQFSKTNSLPKLVNEDSIALPPAEVPGLHPMDAAFIESAIRIVEENMYEPGFNIAILSSKIGMSQPVLLKKIKAITGLSTNDFVKSLRLKKAAELLLQKRHTVYEVSYMVGYEDSKYFSKEFKKYFGKLPSAFADK